MILLYDEINANLRDKLRQQVNRQINKKLITHLATSIRCKVRSTYELWPLYNNNIYFQFVK